MSAALKRPSVSNYQDPIHFLKDWFQYLKKTDRSFSLRELARQSGVSVSYLTMMTQRKRPITDKLFRKIAPCLKLDRLELRTLERLIELSRSTTTEAKTTALHKLQNLKSYREANPAEWEVHRYLSNWLNVAVREVIQLKDFKNDPSWIQERLVEKIPPDEITQAMDLLIKLGLVDLEGGQQMVISKRTLQCHDEIFRISLGCFHAQMLELAAKSITNTSRENRVILGSTIGLPKEKTGELFEMIRDFQKKLEQWAEPFKDIDEIYHFEAAAFPLTKKTGSDQ